MPEPRTTTSRPETSFFAGFAFRPVASAAAWPTIAFCSSPPVIALTPPCARFRSHELVEPVAVALLERRPLRLAVVGEDDELVRPGGVAAGALDAPELLVELPQRLEGVLALEAGVMGDLVVAREGRVDRGPPLQHVGEDAVDDEVADEHAHRRAQQRVDAAPVAARPDVAPALPPRGDQLQDHLPEDEDEASAPR